MPSSSSPLSTLEPTIPTVLLGDFYTDQMEESTDQKKALNISQFRKGYTQLINQYTTDYTNHYMASSVSGQDEKENTNLYTSQNIFKI